MFRTCWRAVRTHFAGTETKRKTKVLTRLSLFQSESLEFVLPHPILEHLIEVADEGGKQQEYGILVHERLGKAFPAKAIVKVIEDALLRATLVVELNNLAICRVVVVCKNTSVCVLSLPEIRISIVSPLSLYDHPTRHAFPLRCHNRVKFEVAAIDFLVFPSAQGEDVIVHGLTTVAADIVIGAMSRDFLNNLS